MFARHTHHRMRASSVVQGFKSLAAAIHPQLPLSPKESSRLLTALTSSFRKHLDEVHPPKAIEEGGKHGKPIPQPGVGSAKISKHAMHSSAALADKHLASVLTNPLLAKGPGSVKSPDQEYASAKVELQKNPAKDPISLLEEYQERGVATVPIARLCLKACERSLEGLSAEARKKELEEVQPGRRVRCPKCRFTLFLQPAN
jgi:DNA-directed RNA polymerase subunit RPC12/RpoP